MLATKVAKARTKAAEVSTQRSALAKPSVTGQRHGDAAEPTRGPSSDFGETPLFSPERPLSALRSMPTKLAVNPPGDRYEQEADHIADEAMSLPVPRAQRVQVQGHVPSTRGNVPTELVDDALRSPGQPLDSATHAIMAGRFGSDFSHVRVHADHAAARSASALSARAYTLGHHVVFGRGEWAPSTNTGRRLLAHELVHVLQQQRAAVGVQRQPVAGGTSTTQPPTQEEFVRDTIRFLEDSAQYYEQVAQVPQAVFDRVIDSWYSMVIRQGTLIDTDLHGDATLKAKLQAAYTSALRVLVRKHAATAKTTEDDLYRINSGRIPSWAQPHPTHLVAGITTPIPDDVNATTRRGGKVEFNLNGFDVMVSPDVRVARQATPGLTSDHIDWGGVSARLTGTRGHLTVASVTGPPTPIATLRTSFVRGANTAGQSGYGRGTTAEDKAGAKVTPASGSLGFHESRHSQAFLDFLRKNPPPKFTGKVGDTQAVFEAALTQWKADVRDYARRMEQADTEQVHCVGFTIDDFHTANARRGQRIVKECP